MNLRSLSFCPNDILEGGSDASLLVSKKATQNLVTSFTRHIDIGSRVKLTGHFISPLKPILRWYSNHNTILPWWSFTRFIGLGLSVCWSRLLKMSYKLLHRTSRPSYIRYHHRICLLNESTQSFFFLYHRTPIVSHKLQCWQLNVPIM